MGTTPEIPALVPNDSVASFLDWLIRLDDPQSQEGAADRQVVNLNLIIGLARKAREAHDAVPVLRLVDTPKAVKEALAVAQSLMGSAETLRPFRETMGRLSAECDRLRPVGPDGRHGNLHTPACGCDRPGGADPDPVVTTSRPSTGDEVIVPATPSWARAEVKSTWSAPDGSGYVVELPDGSEAEVHGHRVYPTRRAGLAFGEFKALLPHHRAAHPVQRKGQSAYNLLFLAAEELIYDLPTRLDPFHHSDRVPAFLEWLSRRWDA